MNAYLKKNLITLGLPPLCIVIKSKFSHSKIIDQIFFQVDRKNSIVDYGE